jgi:hypothetical protein
MVVGRYKYTSTSNVTAHVNVKARVSNCIFIAHELSLQNSIYLISTGANSFTINGMAVLNNTFISCPNPFEMDGIKNTTNVSTFYNNLAFPSSNMFLGISNTAATCLEDGNYGWATSAIISGSGSVSGGDSYIEGEAPLVGGLADLMFYKLLGWSPYRPFEPITPNPIIGLANAANLVATDIYGSIRPMGREAGGTIYYFDASDAAITDPNSIWTSESNITGDTDQTSTGTTTTQGSTSSNYIKAEGTNAPGSGATILGVYVRVWGRSSVAGVPGELIVYTDGLAAALGTLNWSNSGAVTPSAWLLLTVPSGGWDYTKLGALEFKAYKSTSTAATITIGKIEVVAYTVGAGDIGAVEARTRPAQEASVVRSGLYSMKLSGIGFYECFLPVKAQSTVVKVYTRYDSNYNGSLPKMEVFNIVGVADQAVSAVGSANAYEALTLTFTPTAQGLVRVRLSSLDISLTGICYFDDLSVT